MDRRELLKMIAVLTGGAVVGADVFLTGCNSPSSKAGFSLTNDDIAFLNEVGEVIIPTTSTAGAKVVNVGSFMKTIVTDCYKEKERQAFYEGISKLDEACKKMYHARFMNVRPEDRHELLLAIEKESKEHQEKRSEHNKLEEEKTKADPNYKKQEMQTHYFIMMKQLTLWGYFSSEAGMKENLIYSAAPGRYDACIPYKKGDKPMA